MKTNFSSFLVGILFALGLGLGGMTQPQKVIGFLDVFSSAWDPTLLFVMISALLTHMILYRLIRLRNKPLFANQWYVPTRTNIDRKLITGSILFGLGWGLGGYCPAPAVTALISLSPKALVFVIAMLVGMLLFRIFFKKQEL